MKLNNIGQGGHKFRMDDMVHLQTGVIDCLKALSKTVGNNIPGNANYFILDGAIITQSGGSTFITDGWIYWNGEICPITNNLPTGIPVTSNNAYFHLKTTVTPYPGYPDSGRSPVWCSPTRNRPSPRDRPW